jgi:hypothetical protein
MNKTLLRASAEAVAATPNKFDVLSASGMRIAAQHKLLRFCVRTLSRLALFPLPRCTQNSRISDSFGGAVMSKAILLLHVCVYV